jgi:hypothetical protein
MSGSFYVDIKSHFASDSSSTVYRMRFLMRFGGRTKKIILALSKQNLQVVDMQAAVIQS